MRTVHRTVRTALNEAVRRGYLAKNPATLARTQRVDEDEVEPYNVDEIQRLFRTATQTRNGARWAIALALGLRQGEALGLKWSDVDFRTQTLAIRRGRLRPQYEHGCAGKCDRKYAGHCPQRVQTRPETDTTKSRAGRRYVGLPDSLSDLLKEHRAKQNQERLQAGRSGRTGTGCSPRRPVLRSTPGPTEGSGRGCSRTPASATDAFTTHAIPLRQFFSCSASANRR